VLRATTAYTAISAGFGAATLSLLPLYATQIGLLPAALGLALAAGGIGGVLGASIAGALTRWLRSGAVVVASAVIISAAQWLVPAAAVVPGLAVVVLAVSRFALGLALATSTTHLTSIQQGLTPDALQGRMYATVRFIANGSVALGAVAGGLAGEAVGLWHTMVLAAVGATIGVLWLLSSSIWTAENVSQPAPD
jgi:predicted MFS family arabinose efflux permease